MGKSSAPTPDYAAAAASQGAANKETAIAQANLNNPNMVTPYGSSTYSGATDGSGRGTVTQVLSPAEQAKLDASNAIQQQSLGILSGDMPNIQKALSGDFGMSGSAISGFDPKYQIGQTQTQLGPTGQIQTGLNFSKGAQSPDASDSARQAVTNALYQTGSQYLDPQFKNQGQDLDAKLANQGITPGSEAYDRAKQELALQKQSAYSDLTNRSTSGGVDAMNTMFGMGMQARQQNVGEKTTQGEFANSAQAQQLQQVLAALQANNAGVAQQANIAGQSSQLQNQARQQNYAEYSQNRTMPINMLNALLSSGQVNNPQFQPITPTGINAAPIMQGAQLQGQANAAQASANAGILGSGMGAAGTIGAAMVMM